MKENRLKKAEATEITLLRAEINSLRLQLLTGTSVHGAIPPAILNTLIRLAHPAAMTTLKPQTPRHLGYSVSEKFNEPSTTRRQ